MSNHSDNVNLEVLINNSPATEQQCTRLYYKSLVYFSWLLHKKFISKADFDKANSFLKIKLHMPWVA